MHLIAYCTSPLGDFLVNLHVTPSFSSAFLRHLTNHLFLLLHQYRIVKTVGFLFLSDRHGFIGIRVLESGRVCIYQI